MIFALKQPVYNLNGNNCYQCDTKVLVLVYIIKLHN